MTPAHREALRALEHAWRFAVRVPRARALLAGAALFGTLALLLARAGTMTARLSALAVLVATGGLALLLHAVERRTTSHPARMLERVAGRTDPEACARAIRSLSLLSADAAHGASAELAELHVARSLAAISIDDVRASARRVAALFNAGALVLVASTLAAWVANPWGVLEGADVLVARGGVAPFGMTWLGGVQIVARPPDYLREEEQLVLPYDVVALPRGTLLTVWGTPIHAGRRLVLTDGVAEVPFVEDGAGQVVARWPLADSARLRIVARFGEVIIPEPSETSIESIPDAAPVVHLEGAPKLIRLALDEDASEVPIVYEATDDHGLREIHLVLRAGPREERRVLARLDGETRSERGGYKLRASEPFIKKSHAPIEIRVEAKDNDPITGPKWGASDAITIVPPDVGEPEARRLAALVRVRDALVDALAWRLRTPLPAEPAERREVLEEDLKLAAQGSELLETTLRTSYAGVRVSSRLAAVLRGRMRKVTEAVKNQQRSPSTRARANVVKASERTVLVVDAVIQGLGVRDTRDVAGELAEVAEELAAAAAVASGGAERQRSDQRMDAAAVVLEGGGRSMRRLGALGRDIGGIVEADLGRIARARGDRELGDASLAAQDLAARLRQPDPSFGARGGRPSHAGGEMGGGPGGDGDGDDGVSEVERAFNEAARDLEQLAAEHAGNMGSVEQALASGSAGEDLDALSEEARRHAERVREAAGPLPSVGGGSDSWTSKGAAGREHAEQMARALEQGRVSEAVESGRSALGALDEAKRAAARERFGRGDPTAERVVDQARRSLEAEVDWAEEKLDELRRRAAERALPELREYGELEGKLAERARELGRRGREDEALPPAALDALRDAARAAQEAAQALREGNADRGIEKQRDAQDNLETARRALGEGDGDGDDGEGDSRGLRAEADIPNADAHKGPEDFRRRVIKGLGQPSGGKYKDAVKRYAEGLLR